MRSNRTLTFAALAICIFALFAVTACKTSGMALTTRGQLLKINIAHPSDLPESGEDNIDITISNRGVNNVQDILVDVELPTQIVVLDETHDRGMAASGGMGGGYHYTLGKVQPGETANIRLKVRTAFGTMSETGSVKVTAWQRDLPNEKLVETAVIKLRR